MKFVRSIAMNTDHTYHGTPCEVTRIDLYMDESVMTPETVAAAKRNQVHKLREHAKAMPHRYWQKPDERLYAEDLRA